MIMDENKNVVRSIRADEATFEKIKKIAEENKLNQGEFLALLIQQYELEGAKEKIPGSADLIADFQNSIKSLQKTFIYTMDKCYSADERAEAAAADKISSKDKTIIDLQTQLEKAKSDLQNVGERIEEYEKNTAEYTRQFETLSEAHRNAQEALKDKQTIIYTLEAENAKYSEINANYCH